MAGVIGTAHPLRARRYLAGSAVAALLLCRCAVYEAPAGSKGGSGGTASHPAGAGGAGAVPDASSSGGSAGTSNGSAGATGGDPTGAGGIGGSPAAGGSDGVGGAGGAGGSSGVGGTAGSSGAGGGGCLPATAPDLAVYRDGAFPPGWGTVGSWNTCNGTPITATVSTAMALAVDLSCNSYNGAMIINWNSPVPCTYKTLSFDIYFANPADISVLQAFLQASAGQIGLLIPISSLIASPQGKAFNHVTLPLSSFGAGLVFNGVGFFNMGGPGMPLFYVNNVVLGADRADAGTD